MKKAGFIFCFILVFLYGTAQNNWMPVSIPQIPYNVHWLRAMYTDTVNNELYVCGGIYNYNMDSSYVLKYAYDANQWFIIKSFDVNAIRCIIIYHNKLILDGKWMYDGNNWTQIGGNLNGSVYRMKIFNDTLYAMGNFTKIGNISAHCIAKWDGANWNDLYNFTVTYPQWDYICDLEHYQNKWYVSGNFNIPNKNGRCIAVYKNGSWRIVGGGILGTFAEATHMLVYKEYLYVAGMIWKSAGNTGHLIQKWDGNQWTEVGFGLQDAFNGYSNGQVTDMILYHNDLYVCGTFYYAGHVPARVAKWDGLKWCSLGGDFHNDKLNPFGILKDTLLIGSSGVYIDSIYVKHLAKWTGGEYIDTCSGVIKGLSKDTHQYIFTLRPNPTSGRFTLTWNGAESGELSILNIFGQEVYRDRITAGSTGIDLGRQAAGMYFLSLRTAAHVYSRKIMLK